LTVFKLLGVVVALYTVQAALKGEVYAKSGPGGRLISRSESPEYFWAVVVVYGALSVALFTIF
jgi:hypothetical protein